MVKRVLPFLLVLCVSLLFVVPAMASFGVKSFSMAVENQNGSPDVQAGSHPYALTASFVLNEQPLPEPVDNSPRDIEVELPPGFSGNPEATPRCRFTAFVEAKCPADTQVGVETTYLVLRENGEPYPFGGGLYNIEPSPGVTAEFGFDVTGTIAPILLDVSVRTGGDYGLTVKASNITAVNAIFGVTATIWGVPCAVNGSGCLPQVPLLTNPTSCGVPRKATIKTDSWQNPGVFQSLSTEMPEIEGCEKLDFSPSIRVTPDGTGGSTPTGLSVEQHVPQDGTVNPVGLAEANVKDVTVALPAGVQVSPSAADGLLACSEAQFGLHSAGPAECPEASKVGTIEIVTPVLSEPATGGIYLATQNENPFGALVALYVEAENQNEGVRAKVPGRVSLDPVTGQIVTIFEEVPQLPYSNAKLSFFGTDRAPLTTPGLCGTYTSTSSIEPWSGTGAVAPSSKFQITSGPNGSPCANPLPFRPTFQSGTTNLQAGAYTPFELTMSRPDGDQTLGKVELQMPPGLVGSLSSVKLCEEPQAAQGTCGEESLIGHTTVSAGLGGDPYTVSGGKVFITGPYKGAPFGLSIVEPAVAGPFNLGTIVVRSQIRVDPLNSHLTVVSDALPTIIDGIPIQIQHVNVSVDRPGFVFNPTDCEPMRLSAVLSSTEEATAGVGSPFQVTNCGSLAFKPGFSVSTSAKTSRTEGASLHVNLTLPAEAGKGTEANVAKVKVSLPKQLPSPLKTLQKACLEKTFAENPASCPTASKVGEARVSTPLLAGPLTGPAYFVSHGGAKYPELIMVLTGEDGVTVQVHGETFISKAGITSATFSSVPDVPFSDFELTLPQREYPAITANGNLCKAQATGKLLMPTEFVGQDGAVIKQETKIAVTGCPKVKKVTHKKKHKTHGKPKKGKKK